MNKDCFKSETYFAILLSFAIVFEISSKSSRTLFIYNENVYLCNMNDNIKGK